MKTDVSLRCSCGELRGMARDVSADNGNRIFCYCDDCQAFAHYLQRANEILDAHGGSDIFQMSPAGLEISGGPEHLACVQLRPGGLLRWYSSCCRTPLGNTMASRGIPFVGLVHSCMDHAADGRTRDEVLGPSRGGVQGRFAKGDRSQIDAHDKAPPSMLLRVVPLMLKARLRGDHKRSPFFDAESGAPRAKPRVLTAEELAAVEAARDAS